MTRRLILLVLLLTVFSRAVAAQILPTSPKNITLVSSGGTCNTPDTACATYTFGIEPSITFDISGTFTGTLTFEGLSNGSTWRTISVTKLSDGTTATTTTAAGQFSAANAGLLRVRVRATAFASGMAVVFGTAGTAVAKVLSPTLNSILTNDGTAAAPAWSFTLDPDTGVYRIGANTLGISTGGTLAATFSSAGNFLSANQVLANANAFMGFAGSSGFLTNTDGRIRLVNSAFNDFSLLQFGLNTSAAPAIKRNGAALNFRLGDDSADAAITAASLATTAANSFVVAGLIAGPASAPNQAVNIANTTAATAGVPAQWSPGELFSAPGWDTDDAVSRTTHCYWTLQPINGNTVTSQMVLFCETSPFSGTYSTVLRLNNGGQGTFGGGVVASSGGFFALASRSAMGSSADGLMAFNKNAGNSAPAVEMNMGTAVPTVANCSVTTTGVVNNHSTNTAGSVTPGTGSTACDVVFGAPAFSFAPFCVITDYTSVILAPKISARSTTGFTVTGLTAGDTFGYICLGGT